MRFFAWIGIGVTVLAVASPFLWALNGITFGALFGPRRYD